MKFGPFIFFFTSPSRFVPDKGFAGTDRDRRRDGPVQFEREDDEDPFGLDEFLKTVKKADKRPAEGGSSSRSRDDHDRSGKRRKDY